MWLPGLQPDAASGFSLISFRLQSYVASGFSRKIILKNTMPHGVVHAINVSDGGVPKLPRSSAWIDRTGVEGDRQRNLKIHGGPERAVSLYSLELVQALQAEGHPIEPGAIGENLTLAGVPWHDMRPGVRLEIGEVLLQLVSYTAPCKIIAAAFRDADFVRVSHKVHPGWSRLYARVLVDGRVSVGDAVLLERV
jgi:MOSC domain-containing protein YiiM